MPEQKRPLIGFVGQGYVGKNYADNFESRGFTIVRYSLEEEYRGNKDRIRDCDVVFIATPTPTTLDCFDASHVAEGVSLVGKGKIAIIKSTIVPGTTKALQEQFPDAIVLFSPEFLSVATAASDTAHPFANIIGMAADDAAHRAAADTALTMLPEAPFKLVCASAEAEVIKYAHNANGYFQIILSNLLHDLATAHGASWEPIKQALEADPYISNRYAQPVHKSGRGAGGGCFIKDFAALRGAYEQHVPADAAGAAVFRALEEKNRQLLKESGKDLHLLAGVYGEKGAPR